MKTDINKTTKIISSFFATLLLLTGVSAGVFRQRVVDIVKAPVALELFIAETRAHNRMQDSIIEAQEVRIHHLEIQTRMSYETDRILTDNIDSETFEIEDAYKIKYDVNLRGTNEGAEIVFISDLWVQYPLYRDVDGRMYVTLHNEGTHERKGTYITKK